MNPSESISQRLISGGVFASSGKVLFALSALTLNTLLTRLLTPSDVGAYYLILSIVTICTVAAQLGVQQAIVRAVAVGLAANSPGAPRRAIKAAFLVVFCGITIISVPYSLWVGQWLGETLFDSTLVGEVATITACWIGLRAIQMLISQIFRGFHQIGYATFFEGKSTAVLVATAVGYVWLTEGYLELDEVLVITLGVLLLSIPFGLVLLWRPYARTEPAAGADVWGLLRISLPLFVASIAFISITEVHILILGSVSGEDEVAVYGAAFRLAKFVIVPLIVINSVIPPMLAQLFAQGRMEDVERVLRSTATVAGLPSILIVAILAYAAPAILGFLFGEFYTQGATVLLIILIAQAVNALSGSPGVLLMMSDRQQIVMRFAIACGSLGLVMSVLLVKQMGSVGVALGVATGMITHNLGMWVYCRNKLGIRTHMGMRGLREVVTVVRRRLAAKI